MKNKYILSLCLAGCLCQLAHAQDIKDYSINVGEFHELRVRNPIPVDCMITLDSANYASFTTDGKVSQSIIFENKNGRLTISLDPRTFNRENIIPVITLRTSKLNYVVNEGDSVVRVFGVQNVDKFQCKLVGNGTLSVRDITAHEVKAAIGFGAGTVNVSGKCDKAILDNTGRGVLEAGRLRSNETVCYIMGTGHIDCNAANDLSVKGMGSGQVLYTGSPKEVRNRGVGIKVEYCAECESN